MGSKLAIITFIEVGGGHPDQGLPGKPPGKPDQGLPPGQGGHPSHPIYLPPTTWPPQVPPSGAHPDNTLPDSELPPVGPVHLPVFPPNVPDNTLPGSQPKPDQGLPKPDQKFELKYSPLYGWVLVPVGGNSGAKPDNTLPSTPEPKRR